MFDVKVEGALLKNLDVYAEAGFATSLVKTFDVTVTDGELNIGFFSSQSCNYVMINGIEVLAADANYGGNQVPVADLSFACVDLNCRFADRSTDADGTVVAWSWDLGEGNSATSQSPSHTYSSAGDYTVTLIVTDNDGAASAPTTQTLTVSEPTGAGGTKVVKVPIDSNLHKQLESLAVEQEMTIEALMIEAAREIVARYQ